MYAPFLFVSTGTYAYVNHPDIDELFKQQEVATDVKKREALLHKIQQIAYDRVLFVPCIPGYGTWASDHGSRRQSGEDPAVLLHRAM